MKIIRAVLFILLLTVIALFLYDFYLDTASMYASPVSGTTAPISIQSDAPPSESPVSIDDIGNRYSPDITIERFAYEQLPDSQKRLYEKIVSAVDSQTEQIDLSREEDKSLSRVLGYVLADYPEFFWVTGGGNTSYVTVNGVPSEYKFNFEYAADPDKRNEMQAEVDAAAQKILAQIDPAASESEKVKFVHDYIIANTEYNDSLSYDQSLYNVLVNGEGVCAGYAKAFQYLLNRMGIFCAYVTGEKVGGDYHAWNLVRIEGEYYYIDVTWDDPTYSGEEDGAETGVSYIYYCVTTEDILRLHIIDPEWTDRYVKLPKCTATANNYYIKNGLYFDSYDYDRILPLFQDAAAKKSNKVTFRFSNKDAYIKALTRLFDYEDVLKLADDGKLVPSSAAGQYHLRYSYDDSLFIVNIAVQ